MYVKALFEVYKLLGRLGIKNKDIIGMGGDVVKMGKSLFNTRINPQLLKFVEKNQKIPTKILENIKIHARTLKNVTESQKKLFEANLKDLVNAKFPKPPVSSVKQPVTSVKDAAEAFKGWKPTVIKGGKDGLATGGIANHFRARPFDLGGLAGRVGFKDGPVLKGESLKIHLEEFVKNFKIKNNRFPSIIEIRDGAKASTKSIRTYLTEGKDFTVMSRAESAKLGGDTTGAQTKGTIFNISADLQNKVDSTKLRGANLYIDSTKTGSKSLILQITDPKLKGNFFDGKNSLSSSSNRKKF